jgi:hypothetical protein
LVLYHASRKVNLDGKDNHMAIDLYWDDDEQTIMLCEFASGWTWDDLFEMLHTARRVTDERDYEVGAIIDLTHGSEIPGGSIFSASTRENARRVLRMGEDGRGPLVLVRAGSAIRTLLKAVAMLDKSALADVYFAGSLDEARTILQRRLARSKQRTTVS